MFEILMGVPKMENLSNDFKTRKKEDLLSGDDDELFKKFGKAQQFLASDPRHRELLTHER